MFGCMSYLRFAQLLKKGLPTRQVWTKTSLLVSAQVVLMTDLTDFKPLAKRLKVGNSSPTSPSSSPQGSSLCGKRKDNSTVDEEKGQNNTEIKMATQPKTGAGGLRRVKTNVSHQKLGPRQQQNLRTTLDQWLVKPRKTQNTEEVCQTEDVVEMTDDSAFESTSVQPQDCQVTEKHTVSDTDEETQPLTPQDLDEDDPVSPGSKSSAETGLIKTLPANDGGLHKEEMGICAASSEGPAKHNKKITDFFSGTSSSCLPVRRGRPDKPTEEQDADTDSPSADVKPDVKWLGTPISDLKRMPECCRRLPPLKDVPGQHTVMIRTDLLQSGEVPAPYPGKFRDTWDNVHVKMPCSDSNLFPVQDEETQELQKKSRWELIKETLNKEFTSPHELKNAVLKYNASHAQKWDFTALYLYSTKAKGKRPELHHDGQSAVSSLVIAQELSVCSPASFGGHPSSVVLMQSASSCVEKRGGLYYCLAHEGDGNIPFGEMGHVTRVFYTRSPEPIRLYK